MKKAGLLVMVAVLFTVFSVTAFAKDEKKDEKKDAAATNGTSAIHMPVNRMPMSQMPGANGMGMMGMRMPMVGGRQVVATSDGGLVVVVGTTITKYDKDLNVVKTAELPEQTQSAVPTR